MASNAPSYPEEHLFISPAELEKMTSIFASSDISDAVEKLNKYLKSLENAELHIAVTGISGTGKSTFVNVIRGLGDKEEGSAPTGNVQITTIPKQYLHPTFKNVAIWDLPGIGTPHFKPEDYLKQVNFSRYDFFIIILSNRFTCNDAKLALEIKKMKKIFYVVRSKIDNDLNASKRRHGATYDESKEIKEINAYCLTSMEEEGIVSAPLFLVSFFDLGKYDFESLANTLAKGLTADKRYIFLLSLPNVSLSILEKKKAELKKYIWIFAALSCAAAIIPIPGLSFAIDLLFLKKVLTQYVNYFGLDTNSLQKLTAKVGKPLHYIKEVIKSPIDEEISNDIVFRLLNIAAFGADKSVHFVAKAIPFLGGAVASFAATHRMLNTFVDDLAGDAQAVLERTLPTTKE